MKKNARMILLLVLALAVLLCGCGQDVEETQSQQSEETQDTVSQVQSDVPEEPSGQSDDLDSFVCVDQITSDCDITVTYSDGAITLTEDGMTVELSTESVLVYRKGFVTAVMNQPPQIVDGKVYVSADFYDDYLCADGAEQPSLFHGALFYADEVIAALEQQETSEFNQKLLNELLLPTSMEIEAPHIDMDRVFTNTRLSELSDALTNELLALGYSDVENLTYSEYLILSGAQTLEQAQMNYVLESYPELSGIKPDEMTVAEFTLWEREHSRQQFADSLSEEEQSFAKEKQIELSDLTYLNGIYYGAYMEQSEEDLKTALEDYYAVDINYLREMVDAGA